MVWVWVKGQNIVWVSDLPVVELLLGAFVDSVRVEEVLLLNLACERILLPLGVLKHQRAASRPRVVRNPPDRRGWARSCASEEAPATTLRHRADVVKRGDLRASGGAA